jgi:hypothetical protein
MSGRDQALKVRYQLFRMALLFLGSVAFVICAIWILRLDPSELRAFARERYHSFLLATWLAGSFCGICALFMAPAVFDRRTQLWIGSSGIYWRRWSKVEIPWAQISSAEIISMRGSRFVVLNLRDPTAYPGHGVAGLLSSIHRKMGFGDITISTGGLDRSADEILAAIDRFRGNAD